MRHLNVDLLDYKLEKPTTYTPSIWPLFVDTVEPWAYMNNVFTPAQCETIIEIGKNLGTRSAHVGGVNQGVVREDIRKSKTSWISPAEGNDWIFRRLNDAVLHMNHNFFNFELSGFLEGLQFTEYNEPGGKYNPHVDTMYKGRIRKLSISVLLSDPNDFEGGDFSIYQSLDPTILPKQQGTMLAFPSYSLHGVSPVTKGTRYSLVAWISGPKFK